MEVVDIVDEINKIKSNVVMLNFGLKKGYEEYKKFSIMRVYCVFFFD